MELHLLKKDYLALPFFWKQCIDAIEKFVGGQEEDFEGLDEALQPLSIFTAVAIKTDLDYQMIAKQIDVSENRANWILGRVMALLVEKKMLKGDI